MLLMNQVDAAFMDFLQDMFGQALMHDFKQTSMEDALDLHREFEVRKRSVKMDGDVKSMNLKIPVALYDMYEDKNGSRLRDDVQKSQKFAKFRDRVTCAADKIKVDINLLRLFFKKPMEDLAEHIRDILGELPVRGTKTFIVVGGFAESNMVQETLKAKFPNMEVIIPFDAGLAVLKGAVIFGHAPMVITSRVCPRTYGMAVSKLYVEGVYPADQVKETLDGKKIVKNVFHKYMTIGEPTKVGQVVTSLPLSVHPGEPQARVRIFASKQSDPVFVTDRGCSYLGEILVDTAEVTEGGSIAVQMTFGGTELRVDAHEKTTGKSYRSRFDFLNTN